MASERIVSGVNKDQHQWSNAKAEDSEVATNGDGEASWVEESLRARRTKEKHKQ